MMATIRQNIATIKNAGCHSAPKANMIAEDVEHTKEFTISLSFLKTGNSPFKTPLAKPSKIKCLSLDFWKCFKKLLGR
ncbi:MAG: hypothetical protein R3B45_00920 [Bdellovibrionota bacterium]